LVVLGLLLVVASSATAADQPRNNYVPTTISPEVQKALRAVYDAKAYDAMIRFFKQHKEI